MAKHVKSNAIVYARAGPGGGRGRGADEPRGFGQIGAMKAVLPLDGTVVASDAFFPFADGLEEAVQNGATAFIQPGGSVRDAEVIAAADRLGVAMVFTGVRHFRHYCALLQAVPRELVTRPRYTMVPVMAITMPARPATTPMTGNITRREMK